MNTKHLLLAASLLLPSLLSNPARAQDFGILVTIGSDYHPVDGAFVVLRKPDGSVSENGTGPDGLSKFVEQEPGTYSFLVTHRGDTLSSGDFEITDATSGFNFSVHFNDDDELSLSQWSNLLLAGFRNLIDDAT